MITAVKTRKGTDAITSDHWHVVHSHFVGTGERRPFRRSIDSEHGDRTACVTAARALLAKLRAEAGTLPLHERDEVFVRRPGFKSLQVSTRRATRRSAPREGGGA